MLCLLYCASSHLRSTRVGLGECHSISRDSMHIGSVIDAVPIYPVEIPILKETPHPEPF